MKKQIIRILIPLILIACALTYCWIVLLINNYIPSWKHYAALVLFLVVLSLFFKNVTAVTIATGVYLLLATIHIISLSALQSTFYFTIAGKDTPGIQLLSLGLFILYFILNFDRSSIRLSGEKSAKKIKATNCYRNLFIDPTSATHSTVSTPVPS